MASKSEDKIRVVRDSLDLGMLVTKYKLRIR